MLYDVIRQLRATPELIFIAWSQSLDYNIGTAAHSLAAMTALCEKFGLRIGDWFKKPLATDLEDTRRCGPVVDVNAAVDGETPQQREIRLANAAHVQQQAAIAAKYSQIPSVLTVEGTSRKDRQDMLTGYERQRRATSLYRHTCTLDGNADLLMDNPIDMIEHVMHKHGNPPDADNESTPGTSSAATGEFLPLYSSTIMASTVEVCMTYHYQAIVRWCSGNECNAALTDNPTTGTKPCGLENDHTTNITYAERRSSGPCKWNTAWMRMHQKDEANFRKLASDITNGPSHTCKAFDLSKAGLRDLLYMLSTRDNSRRCTEEPSVSFNHSRMSAFLQAGTYEPALEGYAGPLSMRGVSDSRGRQVDPGHPEFEERRRHPYSKVPDFSLQRSLDMASNNFRLPAVMPMVSNKVRDAPPVRVVSDGDKSYLELNTSAAIEHTKMLAEASFRCSLHAGMENMQEAFCDSCQGPQGLQISLDGMSGEASDGQFTTFAYSYDMPAISFTLDAMSRYYDPDMHEYCEMYKDAFFESLSLNVKPSELPHMSLRFVGYKDEQSRRFLSMPLRSERNKAFKVVEVSDESANTESRHTVYTSLQLSLGHEPSDEEIERYKKARSGARSMSGVSGDLMSMRTYREHTLTTLKERGMVSGESDVVLHMVADDGYGLRQRVAERVGMQINKLVSKHPAFQKAKKFKPQDHATMSEEQRFKLRELEKHRVRTKLYSAMELPEHLAGLRKYAPLDVDVTKISKLTYQNREKDAEGLDAKPASRKKDRVDSSTQFKDQARFRKSTLPGKAPASTGQAAESLSGGISIRGRRDARDDSRAKRRRV